MVEVVRHDWSASINNEHAYNLGDNNICRKSLRIWRSSWLKFLLGIQMTLVAHSQKIDTQTVITDRLGRRFVRCAGCSELVPVGTIDNPIRISLLGEFCSFECRYDNVQRFL